MSEKSIVQSKALDALLEIEKRMRSPNNKMDLTEKMFYSTALKTIKLGLLAVTVEEEPASLDVVPQSVAADVEAPVDIRFASVMDRDKVITLSDQLSQAVIDWQNLRDTVSEGIRAPDKKIISISVPARPNEELVNTFDNSTGTLLMILSTAADAFMMTKNSQGLVTITSQRYWKSKNSAR